MGKTNPKIEALQVKKLREKTGAGMMACKKALIKANGNLEKALEFLRQEGLADLKRKSQRQTTEGIIEAYIHSNSRIGVLVEINCETDFVAKNTDFQEFAHNITLQIAAADPKYISREQIPEEIVKKEKNIYRTQAVNQGKPEKVIDQFIKGKMEKFFQGVCLLEQPYIKNPDIKVEAYLGDTVGKIGENINISRFARFEVGEREASGKS